MVKNLLLKSVLLCLLLTSNLTKAMILPPNNLHLEDNPALIANMSEEEFQELIGEVEEIYAPIVKKLGGRLTFETNWDSSQVNAFARRGSFNRWIVAMFGGLARRQEVTKDAFQLVVCHEVGHHVAGWPFAYEWASNEGQSDFFASQVCAKKIWKGDINVNQSFRETVDTLAKEKCDSVYLATRNQNLCYRIAMAGKSLSKLLGQMKRLRKMPSFATPDPREIIETYSRHPRPQCRLDTMFAGALCKTSFDDRIIPQDERESLIYSCDQFNPSHNIAYRPKCWLKQEIRGVM